MDQGWMAMSRELTGVRRGDGDKDRWQADVERPHPPVGSEYDDLPQWGTTSPVRNMMISPEGEGLPRWGV